MRVAGKQSISRVGCKDLTHQPIGLPQLAQETQAQGACCERVPVDDTAESLFAIARSVPGQLHWHSFVPSPSSSRSG